MVLSNMIPIIVGRWNIRAKETVKSHCIEPKEDAPHGDMEALLPMQQVPMKSVKGKGLHLTHENKCESMKGSFFWCGGVTTFYSYTSKIKLHSTVLFTKLGEGGLNIFSSRIRSSLYQYTFKGIF